MTTNTLAFLQALYHKVPGYLTFTVRHPTQSHPVPSRHVELANTAVLNATLKAIQAMNTVGWGAYLSLATRRTNLERWRRGTRENLAALSVLFVDIDHDIDAAKKKLRTCPWPPSCLVSSGSGLHAYWFLDQPTTDFPLAQQLLKGLANYFDGDRTNVSQMLRLPGTLNTKPSRHNVPCHILSLETERRYPLSAFTPLVSTELPIHATCRPHTEWYSMRRTTTLNPDLLQAVISRLCSQYHGYTKANGYVAALCPCGHTHDRAGSHFNFDPVRGLGHCFGRHGRLLLKDLCELLRIDLSVYGGLYT